MRFVLLSDTHGKHDMLQLPSGDVLIHAGDVSSTGTYEETVFFLNWFSQQAHPYKIFIAGNHDFFFEQAPKYEITSLIPPNVIYLCNQSIVINNLTIWGSPITPYFYNWAFNRHRGPDIKKYWDMIPLNTDILVTHGPCKGILDKTTHNIHAGCADLLNTVKVVTPKLHVFGHIHEANGQFQDTNTLFVNASVLNERYVLRHAPVVIEL